MMTTTGTEAQKQWSCEHCHVVYPNEELLTLHNEMHKTANDQVCIIIDADRRFLFGLYSVCRMAVCKMHVFCCVEIAFLFGLAIHVSKIISR